jgi:hypothetical protein
MAQRITAARLLETSPDLLARVQGDHEQFVIEFEGKPVATPGPTEDAGITWHDFAARYATLPRPDDAFADDLEAIHTSRRPIDPPE